jgi:hypothetical protein
MALPRKHTIKLLNAIATGNSNFRIFRRDYNPTGGVTRRYLERVDPKLATLINTPVAWILVLPRTRSGDIMNERTER